MAALLLQHDIYIYSNWFIHAHCILNSFPENGKNDCRNVLKRKGFFKIIKFKLGEIKHIDSCTIIANILEVIILWTDSVKMTTNFAKSFLFEVVHEF